MTDMHFECSELSYTESGNVTVEDVGEPAV